MISSPLPVQQNERAVVVDVVRGFALVGVLFANFNSYITQQLPSDVLDSISSPFDNSLSFFNSVFLEWKFMTTFSILFGYGFGLILESLEKKNIHPVAFFSRRMFWIFIIGLVHTLFWWGDVLHFYAISGILLLLFRKCSPRTLLGCALIFMFILPPFVSWLFRAQPDYFTDENLRILYDRYKNGNLMDVFRMNVNLYYGAFIKTGGDIHDILETLGRFLFGYFLLRVGLFRNVEEKKSLFKKVLLITGPIMIAYFIVRWLTLNGTMKTEEFYWEPLKKIGIISTSCFYCSTLVLCFISFGKARLFSALQALGKMTLTNYLLVSSFLIVLLYGIGFGKLGSISLSTIWLCAIGWLIVEILFSLYWLRKFRYGPMEWIWRQLTYRKRIPLRK